MAFFKRPVFPQELTDMIIDNLRDDAASLQQASLVSTRWMPRSRMHMFEGVSVSESNGERNFIRFGEFLAASPTIARHIQHLILRGHQYDLFTSTLSLSPSPLTPYRLACTLSQLPRLRTLQLHEVSFRGGASLPRAFKPVALDELVIMNAGSARDTTSDVLRILSLFSEVDSLHMSAVAQDIEFDEESGEDDGSADDSEDEVEDDTRFPIPVSPADIPRHLRVHKLKLEDVASNVYLEALAGSASVHTLESIDVGCMAVDDAFALSSLLHHAGPTIIDLAVDLSRYLQLDDYPGEVSDDIDVPDSRAIYEALEPGLAVCTNLEKLHVTVSFSPPRIDGATYHDVSWDCLIGVLSCAPPTVKTITVELSTEEWATSVQELDLDWDSMNAVWKRFEQLRHLTVAAAPGSDWQFSKEDRDALRAKLEESCETIDLCV